MIKMFTLVNILKYVYIFPWENSINRFCPKGICHLKTSEVVCEFECDSGYIMDVYPCLQILYKMV